MKSSLEEIKIKPQYVFHLELTSDELQDFYLLLHPNVPEKTKQIFGLTEDDFRKLEETNSKIFEVFRDAVNKLNQYWEA